MKQGKEQKKVHGNRAEAGVAYVYIPANVDRDKYVRDAMRTNYLSLTNGYTEKLDNVRMASHILNQVEFPEDTESLGSMVLWVNIPKNNQPVAVAVIPKGNEIYDLLEGQFNFRRSFEDTVVDVTGDANEGTISINVFSSSKSPKILLNASHPDKKAEVEVRVAGNLKATAENEASVEAKNKLSMVVVDREVDEEKITKLIYELGKGLSYKDEFENEILADKDKVNLKAKTVILGDGEEPLVLGDTLSSLLDEILSAISSITVATSIGAQPILNKAQVEALKKKIDPIKSKLSSTD